MLLFLPGLICDARTFAPQLAAFPDSRAIDGYGTVDTLEGMARVALEQAPESFDLFGHSMGGRIALEVFRPARQALVIPEIAVVQVAQEAHVFVVQADGTVKQRIVELGARRAGEVEVVEGLAAGERIVVDGTVKLRDGARVTETPADSGEAAAAPAG